MVKTRLGRIAAAAVTLAFGLGCAIGNLPSPGNGNGVADRGSAPSADEADATVRAAIGDVERFWSAAYPKLSGGVAFQKVAGGYHPYTTQEPPPACGQQRPEYQPNAFYCPDGDFIAWDAEVLIPQLAADYGRLLVAVVVAHEYGHAVQERLGLTQQPTIVLEQQADCFAGSWIADVAAGHSDAFAAPQPQQLDNTVAGLLSLRDQPGVSAQAPQAHGNAFDRVRALQEGIEQGPARCAAYSADNLPVTEIPFSSRDEAASGGDLPYGRAVTELGDDVQAYWKRVFPQLSGSAWPPLKIQPFDPSAAPQCRDRQPAGAESAFYCPSGDFVAFDNRQLGPQLYRHIGDNAVGMLLGDLFARAVQVRRGQSADGRAGQLTVDCLAGTWANDLLRRPAGDGLRLSPGDLDEAVATLLVLGRAAATADASAFDRIGAFRNGVLGGLPGCA
ncbi:neutral zinc metallopeptidase [Dactylosporangium matsuzakiense]|uniref:Aminopeptidase n=1 Tax=Dactylosporangium matsuzakiense TaxID=53360 RepID=A0A9W6NN23_9ACTN|nr:neutral zinc metallopeptidase [Dactylosporangium matsuzakiense]UWZ48676.1 neutral zinc metallopeptidase [Dactylosporangium matsuzakiense]GLL03044.1 aminopeptidase [Dactylosporangium matsuzakiense]